MLTQSSSTPKLILGDAKNHIQRLQNGQGWAILHKDKQECIRHFQDVLSGPNSRSLGLSWEVLGVTPQNLDTLEEAFSEEEVANTLAQIPGDKAPGPDSFTFLFFKSCWTIIKADIMAVFHSFHTLRTSNVHLLNIASVALIPKKDEAGAERVVDFRCHLCCSNAYLCCLSSDVIPCTSQFFI